PPVNSSTSVAGPPPGWTSTQLAVPADRAEAAKGAAPWGLGRVRVDLRDGAARERTVRWWEAVRLTTATDVDRFAPRASLPSTHPAAATTTVTKQDRPPGRA